MDGAAEPKPRFDHKVIRPNGPWVPARETDVRKTWARARERLRRLDGVDLQDSPDCPAEPAPPR